MFISERSLYNRYELIDASGKSHHHGYVFTLRVISFRLFHSPKDLSLRLSSLYIVARLDFHPDIGHTDHEFII